MPRNKQKNLARAVAHQAELREKKQYAGKINRAFAKLSGASLPRVEQALRAPNWRNKPDDSGAICIPEVAQFAAGHRKKTDSITAR